MNTDNFSKRTEFSIIYGVEGVLGQRFWSPNGNASRVAVEKEIGNTKGADRNRYTDKTIANKMKRKTNIEHTTLH